MKRIIFSLLSVFIIASSFNLPSCQKECNTSTIQVTITFDDDSETVTFTGEQGQGTYMFDPANTSQLLPDNGTYQICIAWNGGCGGYRLSDANSNLLLVGPAGGSSCADGMTVTGQYYAWTNCE